LASLKKGAKEATEGKSAGASRLTRIERSPVHHPRTRFLRPANPTKGQLNMASRPIQANQLVDARPHLSRSFTYAAYWLTRPTFADWKSHPASKVNTRFRD
jgi:hypothetical protein